jgi:hypothetical protein
MKASPVDDEQQDGASAPHDRKAVLGQTLRHRILSMELAPGASLDEAAGDIVLAHVLLARRNMASYVAPDGVDVNIPF